MLKILNPIGRLRRRVFVLTASARADLHHMSGLQAYEHLHCFLQNLGFDTNSDIQPHTQPNGDIIYVQDVQDNGISTHDLVSLVLLEAGFPKESIQRVFMRAWEEGRDPVEIAHEEVKLIEKLGG